MHIILLFLLIYIETSIIFLLCGFEFLAYMFLIIYAGAIVILFIFILMLVNFKYNKILYNSTLIFELVLYILYLFLIFFIIFFYNIEYNTFFINNKIKILENLIMLHYFYNIFNYTSILEYTEFSDLTKIGILLYQDKFIETLLIGLILLLSLVYIIYYLKK
jgi:NADH:ubiquinone oxidoreductase subunit 6 (subunit J)